MKRLRYIGIFLYGIVFWGCYQDNGNYDYTEIPDITISGIETSYSKSTGVDYLDIEPEITTSYPEKDLEYAWIIYDSESNIDTLSRERNLNYLVNENVGDYILFLYVKNTGNGYYRHAQTKLIVGTEYTRGQYILKETASGDTELDLLLNDDRKINDVLTLTQGQPLGGKPRSLGVIYERAMVDPDSHEKVFAHCLGLITYDKNINILRASDMYLAFDNTNIYYDYQENTPYMFSTGAGMICNEYLTSDGLYTSSASWGGFYGPGMGKLGFPAGEPGGSDHWAYSLALYGFIYWDETNGRFMYTDLYGSSLAVIDNDHQTSGLDYDCLFAGPYRTDVNFILRDRSTSNLYLYTLNSTGSAPKVRRITDIDRSSKMYGATHFASNEINAELIYFVNDNKIYYYVPETGSEYELTASGLSDGTITYISNRYYTLASPSFDYFVVATSKDGKYTIQMYEMIGGLPYGEPVRSTTGEGTVKEMHYLGTVTYSYYPYWDLGYYYSR